MKALHIAEVELDEVLESALEPDEDDISVNDRVTPALLMKWVDGVPVYLPPPKTEAETSGIRPIEPEVVEIPDSDINFDDGTEILSRADIFFVDKPAPIKPEPATQVYLPLDEGLEIQTMIWNRPDPKEYTVDRSKKTPLTVKEKLFAHLWQGVALEDLKK